MHGPVMVSWLLVLVCAGTGAYCLSRVRHASGGRRRTALIESVMGLGMAVMALPAAVPLPLPPPGFYALLFGAVAVHALRGVGWERQWRIPRGGGGGDTGLPGHSGHSGHCVHHAVEALAMVYMALVMRAASGGAAHGAHAGHGADAGGVPLLTGVLLLYLTVQVLRTGPLIASGGTAPGVTASSGTGTSPPGLADACRLTLSLGTLTMLLAL